MGYPYPILPSLNPRKVIYGREVLSVGTSIAYLLHVHSARAARMLWYLPPRDICGFTSEAMDYVATLDGLISF
jgi:hypothetical protein